MLKFIRLLYGLSFLVFSQLTAQLPQLAQSDYTVQASLDSIGTDLASKSSMGLVPLFALNGDWVHGYLDLAGADYNQSVDSIQIKLPEHDGDLSYGYFFQHHESSVWEPKRILFLIEGGHYWHRKLSVRIWLDRNHNLDFTDEKPEILVKGRSKGPISFSDEIGLSSGVRIRVFPENKFYRFSKMNDVSIGEMQGNRNFIGTRNSLKAERVNIRYAPFLFRSDTLLIGVLDANSNGKFNDAGIDQWLISPGSSNTLSSQNKVAVGKDANFAWLGYAFSLSFDSTSNLSNRITLVPRLKCDKTQKSLLNGSVLPRFKFCTAEKNQRRLNSRKIGDKKTLLVIWSAENQDFIRDSSYIHELSRKYNNEINWVFLNFGGSGKYVSYYNRRYDINVIQGFCNSSIAEKLRLQQIPQFLFWDERKHLIFNSNNVGDLHRHIQTIHK